MIIQSFHRVAHTIIFIAVIALSACAGSTAAGNVNADGTLIATAQADQYYRDAEATQAAREQEIAAIAKTMQAADAQATATMAANTTATAIAAQHQTETAAADSVRQTETSAARKTSTAVAEQHLTETAAANKTATAIAETRMTQTAEVELTLTAIAQRQAESQARRDEIVTVAGWVFMFALGLALAGFLAWLAAVAIRAYRNRASLIRHGLFDTPLLVMDAGGRKIILDPARMFGPATVIDQDAGAVEAPQLAPPPAQERTTARAQAVALQQAAHSPHAPTPALETKTRRRLGPAEWVQTARPVGATRAGQPHTSTLIGGNGKPGALPAAHLAAALPTEAPWELFTGYSGDALPLGLNVDGQLMLADVEEHPHRLFAGKTGSGKSRRGVRPLIASVLARGWFVVALGDNLAPDLKVFDSHANFHFLLLQQPEDAIAYFMAVVAAIKTRHNILYEQAASTWGRLRNPAGPRVMIVADEFSALADEMTGKDKSAFFRVVSNASRLGRKAGYHLVAGVQNPTGDNIRPSIKRNLTPVCYPVDSAIASQVVIDAAGAERLQPGQYLARLTGNAIRPGVAFAPVDEQIAAFLSAHPHASLAPPAWLQDAQQTAPAAGHDDQTTRIQALHAAGKSMNAIQREIFGYTGGKAYEAVKCALNSSTTTEPARIGLVE